MGHHHLLEIYLRGYVAQQPYQFQDVSEFQYEQAWRTCKWQLEWLRQQPAHFSVGNTSSNYTTTSSHFHMGAYHCLRFVQIHLFLIS